MKDIETLLIEDNELMLDTVKRILVRNEYKVTSCYNLIEAQKILGAFDPKVIIVTTDSFNDEILTFIKKNKENHHSKYFLVSSSDNEVEMLKAGADEWLKKPYKLTVLLTRLEVLCREI